MGKAMFVQPESIKWRCAFNPWGGGGGGGQFLKKKKKKRKKIEKNLGKN